MQPQRAFSRSVLALCALSACSSGMGGSGTADTTMSPAKTAQTAVGPVLADSRGMTLYMFDKDAADKSNCNGPCATNWPPLTAAADAKPSGDWTLVTRADGKMQWAYKGHPLYDWSKDQKPGDTTGDGFLNGAWHAARP